MKHRSILNTLIALIIIFTAAAVPSLRTHAAPGTFLTLKSVVISSCTPGVVLILKYDWAVDAGDSATWRTTTTNLRTNTTSTNQGSNGGPTGPHIDFVGGAAIVPAGTIAGDTLKVVIVADSTTLPDTLSSLTFNCSTGAIVSTGGSSSTANDGPKFFNPGDNRVDGRPADRIVIWCNQPDKLVVYGTDPGQPDYRKGFELAVFSVKEIKVAGDQGLVKDAGEHGKVSVSLRKGWYWVAWNGGKFKATGQNIFVKNFPETICVK